MAPPPAPTSDQVEKKVEDQDAVVAKKNGRRKALLIGISQVREKEKEPQVQDDQALHRRHSKKLSKSERKVERGVLKGPHRDVKAMKLMLEGASIL